MPGGTLSTYDAIEYVLYYTILYFLQNCSDKSYRTILSVVQTTISIKCRNPDSTTNPPPNAATQMVNRLMKGSQMQATPFPAVGFILRKGQNVGRHVFRSVV
jgi:hypothetical protein